MKIIEVKKLKKSINGNPVLKDVNLTVFKGEIYGFLGKNGAGKTTTLRIILGLLKRDGGEIKIFEENLTRGHFKKIGVMFEYETLNPEWTVLDNLKQTCYIYGIEEREIYKYLDIMEFSRSDLYKKVKQLSKGMKRKISLINAILPEPELLILDEPTSGLDPEMQLTIREILLEFKSQGKTILFSSHNLNEVQKISDRIGLIKEGETLIEIQIKKELYLVEGNYPELLDNKVKDKNLYVVDEKVIKEFNIQKYQAIKDIEELYIKIMGMEA
ncbi:ABC-2 type transport system ATP-binding protein [Thermoanaerobacter uzonensis DSM 18761]|uniref:ABC-2 type transport system ATP-binding protein n=1 Tax=Thermoanaerobacter uzonensis DSM 18761 TaxID=1123369 RepID=A0A1M4TEQ8_9THEO|nr:ATP-binding cassette domain-containing protein [Thermoanaerobacter uzonensis]SHE42865.1 ABC-2 type transport system ATP-binding protein [Thermoanaerobacter uzonensis DSM 18761]